MSRSLATVLVLSSTISAVWSTPARADERTAALPAVRSTATVKRPLAGWPVLELRGGVDGSAAGAQQLLCAEASPLRFVAFEACGTASGILFPASPDATELAHFRGEASLPLLDMERTDITLQAGGGLAEVQHGSDAPGFVFGPARSPNQAEGAGPEGSIALKMRGWAHPHVYVSAEINAGAAWIPSAPTVISGSRPVVPFATGTLGVGF